MRKQYVFVIEQPSGERKATFLVGIHGTLEQIKKKVADEYPDHLAVVGSDELFRDLVGKNMLYIDGQCVERPPYVPTQAEINAEKIAELKAELASTDYKCLKYVDGALTEEEYAETKKHRADLRKQINELEEK